MKKLKNFSEIKRIAKSLKQRKKRIVFTNGCFDILHYAHVTYLERCKNLGDVLIIGLNSDSSVRRIKGRFRPITGQKERAGILSALEFVDYVVIFNEPTPERLIKVVNPDILAKGGDWKKEEIVGSSHVTRHGGKIFSIPFVKGYSTTKILQKIKGL